MAVPRPSSSDWRSPCSVPDRSSASSSAPMPRAREALRRGGVAVTELPFGGLLRPCHALGLPPRHRGLSPGRRADLDEPGEPALPARRFRACCAARGLLRFEVLPGLRPSHRQYPRHRRIISSTRVGPRERAHYLPNFVAAERRRRCRARASTRPTGVPLALALGRLHPNKGFDTLLAALAMVPDLHLWLAGEGALREALEGQARLARSRRARPVSRLARGCGGAAGGGRSPRLPPRGASRSAMS